MPTYYNELRQLVVPWLLSSSVPNLCRILGSATTIDISHATIFRVFLRNPICPVSSASVIIYADKLTQPIASHYTVSVDLRFKGYSHEGAAEKEHEDKICRPATERTLLEHSTVTIGEDHVKQKVEANGPKEHEICHQSPKLKQAKTKYSYS